MCSKLFNFQKNQKGNSELNSLKIFFSTFQKGKIPVDDFSTWVSLGSFLLWSVNHSFHKRFENDFFTWVFLDMVAVCVPLLLTFESWWFINKVPIDLLTTFSQEEIDFFSTWAYLGIFFLWSVNHSFHKRNKDDYKSEESMSNHRSRRPILWMKDLS